MNALLVLLASGTVLSAVTLTAGVVLGRPLTELDLRLSAVDAELDGRSRPVRSWSAPR